MTCIIAIKTDKEVYIGGDLLGSSPYNKGVVKHDKVFCSGDMIFGYCGSFRAGDILKYYFVPPQRVVGEDTMTYLVTGVIASVRQVLAQNNFEASPHDSESYMNASFILCYEGRIFDIQEDYSVLEWDDNVICIGSGQQVCKAYAQALMDTLFDSDEFYSKKKNKNSLSPEQVIVSALQYTETVIPSVGGIGTIYKQPILEINNE